MLNTQGSSTKTTCMANIYSRRHREKLLKMTIYEDDL